MRLSRRCQVLSFTLLSLLAAASCHSLSSQLAADHLLLHSASSQQQIRHQQPAAARRLHGQADWDQETSSAPTADTSGGGGGLIGAVMDTVAAVAGGGDAPTPSEQQQPAPTPAEDASKQEEAPTLSPDQEQTPAAVPEESSQTPQPTPETAAPTPSDDTTDDNQEQQEPTPSPEETASPPPEANPSQPTPEQAAPTPQPTPEPEPTPEPTPEPEATPEPTPQQESTPEPTPEPTAEPEARPEATQPPPTPEPEPAQPPPTPEPVAAQSPPTPEPKPSRPPPTPELEPAQPLPTPVTSEPPPTPEPDPAQPPPTPKPVAADPPPAEAQPPPKQALEPPTQPPPMPKPVAAKLPPTPEPEPSEPPPAKVSRSAMTQEPPAKPPAARKPEPEPTPEPTPKPTVRKLGRRIITTKKPTKQWTFEPTPKPLIPIPVKSDVPADVDTAGDQARDAEDTSDEKPIPTDNAPVKLKAAEVALNSRPVKPVNPMQTWGYGQKIRSPRPKAPPVDPDTIDYMPEDSSLRGLPGAGGRAAGKSVNHHRRSMAESFGPSYLPPARDYQPVPLRICNGFELCASDDDSKVLVLRGINWFGFESGQTSVDGLWAGNKDPMTQDVVHIVRRMKAMGFNAVRLPFSFQDLYNLRSKNWKVQGCKAPRGIELLRTLIDPETADRAESMIPVALKRLRLKAEPKGALQFTKSGDCNAYYPNSARPLERFTWLIRFLTRNGFAVVIDDHANFDKSVIEDREFWVQSWTDLMERVNADPYSRAYTIFDILNEPDSRNLRWGAYESPGCPGGTCPGMGELYHQILQIGYKINPKALYMVEGCGQGLLGANWGDGFATDGLSISTMNAKYRGGDPNPFFKQLVRSEYRNNVIISPHVYPPSITFAQSGTSGAALRDRLSRSFGRYNRVGYTYEGKRYVFPIVLGEFGSYLSDPRNRCAQEGCIDEELRSLRSIREYMANEGECADNQHYPIRSWFWWSWNANSGDTGGIVEDDWKTINWEKVRFLRKMNLRPWYVKPIKSHLAS